MVSSIIIPGTAPLFLLIPACLLKLVSATCMAAAQRGIRLPNKLCGKGGDRPQNRTEKPEELVCPAACSSETGALPAIEHESGKTGQKTDRIKGLITNKFGTNLLDVITFL
jgi:hypothetical protein